MSDPVTRLNAALEGRCREPRGGTSLLTVSGHYGSDSDDLTIDVVPVTFECFGEG